MADYQSLLTRAIANLPNASVAAARQTIYDRARSALVTQLRSLRPPLPDSDIEREERALDSAIAQVEEQFGATTVPARGAFCRRVRPSAGAWSEPGIPVASAGSGVEGHGIDSVRCVSRRRRGPGAPRLDTGRRGPRWGPPIFSPRRSPAPFSRVPGRSGRPRRPRLLLLGNIPPPRPWLRVLGNIRPRRARNPPGHLR